MSRLYSIWMEGFATTGQSRGATYYGEWPGETFRDACQNWINHLTPDQHAWFKISNGKNPPSFWGCRLFDNEEEARRSFG